MGTKCDGSGNLRVRYLNWNGDRWNWNYNWLDNDWNDDNPAVLRACVYFFPDGVGEVCFLIWFLHPPSILPASINVIDKIK